MLIGGFMEYTTLCYIEKDGKYLMLHRDKHSHDINLGKWIGIGGHIETFETPETCIKREVFEETGLTLKSLTLRGILRFCGDFEEITYLYTSSDFSGEITPCDEGELAWIDKKTYFLYLFGREIRFF